MPDPGSRVVAATGLEPRYPIADVHPRYLDEDVSALEAGARVLALAEDDGVAVLERLRLLAMAARNLDDFFRLRGDRHRAAAAVGRGRAVRLRVQEQLQRQARLLRRLGPRLAIRGLALCEWSGLQNRDRQHLGTVFRQRLLAALAPVVTEPGRPLPPPADLSLTVAVRLRHRDGQPRFGSVELPPVLERFVFLPDGRPVPLEELVQAHLAGLFEGCEILGHAIFRVTRQAEAGTEASADLLAVAEARLRSGRTGAAVRLEVGAGVPDDILRRLVADLDLTDSDVYMVHGLLGMADLSEVAELEDRPRRPAVPPASVLHRGGVLLGVEPPDLFSRLDSGDVLVHAPFDACATTTDAFFAQAASDPGVLAIKQVLYRPLPDGPQLRSLVRAAERGRHVVVLVELSARLSERDSVACARALDRAGAHVVYGLVGLRTHCPVTLVVARRDDAVARYCLVGTAPLDRRRWEGMCLLSADPVLGSDLGDLFNHLTGYSRPAPLRRLLVAPASLRQTLMGHVRTEAAAGPKGRIRIKVNRLVDREMIDALYAASDRGTSVELVVSGACSLRPGVRAMSENVDVVAPAGRRPETSRLFGFGRGEGATWYLSSADLAVRNLDRQVDVAVPVGDSGLRARLDATFDALMGLPAWRLGPDGAWRAGRAGAEQRLVELAAAGAAPLSSGYPPEMVTPPHRP